MPDLLIAAAVATAVFAVAAAAQAVTGFGLALVAVPVLALVADPVAAVVGTTVVSLLLTLVAAVRDRAHVDRGLATTLSWTGLLGIPAGVVALAILSEQQLLLLVAVVLLALVGALSVNLRVPCRRRTLWTAGVTSGALLASTGMNGPPLVVVLDGARLAPRRFRATLQSVFCVQDAFAVAAFVVASQVSQLGLVLAVGGALGTPLGWSIGDRVFHAIPEQLFRRVVLAGLGLTAVVAVLQAIA